jgi:hypothetical protein
LLKHFIAQTSVAIYTAIITTANKTPIIKWMAIYQYSLNITQCAHHLNANTIDLNANSIDLHTQRQGENV